MIDKPTPKMLREKLIRALKAKAVLRERSKQLEQHIDDFRSREGTMNHIASELLERQRELNYMLHRASSVLHQLQDTNLALSAEFTHLVKELPLPKDSDRDETIARVNELFKKTHDLAGEIQDEIFRKAAEPEPPAPPTGESANVSSAGAWPFTSEPHTDAPDPEPAAQEQCDLESEGVCDTEVQAPAEASVGAEGEDAEVVEAHAPAPEDPERDESIEQLFRNLQSVELDPAKWGPDGRAREPARKPGLLSRLLWWRRRKAETAPGNDADEAESPSAVDEASARSTEYPDQE